MDNSFFSNRVAFYVLGPVVIFIFVHIFILNAPSNFPTEIVISIESGMNLRGVSLRFKNEHIIRSRLAFEAFVILYGGEKHIIYSDYFFEKKLSAYEIAKRISKGEHHMAPVVVTIPEGFDITQIADAFVSKLGNFDKDRFLSQAQDKEGYLFPDTYFFLTTNDDRDVLKSMNDNFNKKINTLMSEIESFDKTAPEIVVMASIIEREAKGGNDRGVISGILWKRIKLNIPLQVDAALETYKTRGLPKDPISNPGLNALKAAIHPENSPYLYYLHDKDGNVHYARTFSEHVKNKLKYL